MVLVPFDLLVVMTCSEPACEAVEQSLIVAVQLRSASPQTIRKPQYANYVGVSPARLHVVPAPEQEPFKLTSRTRACTEITPRTSLFPSQENGLLAERRATEHFERLFEALQERRSDMLRSIEQSRNQRMGQLKAQV